MKIFIVLTALCLWTGAARADERLLVDARVNGKLGRFAFDSGASDLIVFPDVVERLGLRVSRPAANAGSSNSVVTVFTALTRIELGHDSFWTTLKVMGRPSYLDPGVDGLIGWSPVRRDIFKIDAAGLKVEPLTNVPEGAAAWTQFRIPPRARLLALELPGAGSNVAVMMLDTADDRGVSLSPKRWNEWKAANPHQPATLSAVIMPGFGIAVKEQAWAKELVFGPLTLTDVPVTEFNEAQSALSTNNEAILGIAALKQLDLIVDGKQGIAYVQPHAGPRAAYQHNRLGAIFAPGGAAGDDLVAQVMEGSPAYEAGIRNGDVLLKIGELDATKWQTDPAVLPLSRFWNRPAGEKLELTVKRGSETLQKTVVLKDILGPEKNPTAKIQK